MLKKILILTICSIIGSSANAAPKVNHFANGVKYYKTGDYIKAKDSLMYSINADPSNALAHYYFAMCCVRFGDVELAKREYHTVINLNKSAAIATYATKGLELLGDKVETAKADDNSNNGTNDILNGQIPQNNNPNAAYMPAFNNNNGNNNSNKNQKGNLPTSPGIIPSTSSLPSMSPPGYIPPEQMKRNPIDLTRKEKVADTAKYGLGGRNEGVYDPPKYVAPVKPPMYPVSNTPPPPSYYQSKTKSSADTEDITQPKAIEKNKVADSVKEVKEVVAEKKSTDSPSAEDMKKALEVLSKAGLMNNNTMNPEMMQMQMMMGTMNSLSGMNNNNNSMGMNPMSSMMPMLMSQYGNKSSGTADSNVNAELMQSMMTNMMMPSMFNSNNNDNGSNY
ncbi:MAG: hypothetical protein WCK67_09240 [bacterium]